MRSAPYPTPSLTPASVSIISSDTFFGGKTDVRAGVGASRSYNNYSE